MDSPKNKVGRPAALAGKKKKRHTVRAYPSDVLALKEKGKSMQNAIDIGIAILLNEDVKR